MSELIWCSSEEWQTTETFRNLRSGALGVQLVFNSVAWFSGGVSCPSEVRVFTVL